jgi:glycosyltransferase involved in cell wall biosynthesis/SAM-dependent methyltransferase
MTQQTFRIAEANLTAPQHHVTVQQVAQRLIDRTLELAGGLRHGEADLIWQRVCVISDRAEDFFLASLLVCFGAHVVFRCPRQPKLEEQRALLQYVVQSLERHRPDLDLRLFSRWVIAGIKLDEDIVIDLQPWQDDRTTFDIVFALGILPPEPAAAMETLQQLMNVVRMHGQLELLDTPTAPLPAATEHQLADAAGWLQFAVSNCTHTDHQGHENWRGVRLSLYRLSYPLHEYPVEGRDSSVVMTHCLTRLDFAAAYVPGGDVLEAGAATGIGGRMFLERGARSVVCLDRCQEALLQGAEASSDSRLRFCRWDLNQSPLPFPDESFDVVVCLEVLEHITAHETAIAEFLRVLRPSGRLLVSIPDEACENGWAEINRFGNPHHLRVPSRDELLALLAPFERVSLATQRDFTGSAVVEEDITLPTGEFVANTADVASGLASVQVAVCVKASAAAARPPARRIKLQLYENSTARQLSNERHADHLERLLLQQRHKPWQAVNAARNRRMEEFRRAILYMAHTGGAIISLNELWPGRWMPVTREAMEMVLASAAPYPFQNEPPQYMLDTDGEEPALNPVFEHYPQIHAVLFPVPRARVSALTMRRWLRFFVRDFWFFEADGWQRLKVEDAFPPFYQLARNVRRALTFPARMAAATLRTLLASQAKKPCEETLFHAGSGEDTPVDFAGWQRWIEANNRQLAKQRLPRPDRPLRITHYIGALYCGGAERQLCNLARGQQERGHRVEVLTTYPPEGDAGHYQELLNLYHIPVRAAGMRVLSRKARKVFEGAQLANVTWEIRTFVRLLYAELVKEKPDVLHCWLDHGNIVGAIAGLLAGVPRILMSFRNSNPTHFPRFYKSYMQPWYQVLAASKRIEYLSNSHSGAASYATWINIPSERIHVVLNGLCRDHFPQPSDANREAARRLFGLAPEHKVVAGLFRFDEQKQPELFLQVIRQAAAQVEHLRVLIAGVGHLEEQMRAIIERDRMTSYVHMLGRLEDVSQVLLASDVLLLTSTLEGCPNAVMEAQYLGVPVVATDAGGTCDALIDGQTGFLTGIQDDGQLTERIVAILNDETLRLRLASRARAFAVQAFDQDQMVELVIRVYRQMLQSEAKWQQIATPVSEFASDGEQNAVLLR